MSRLCPNCRHRPEKYHEEEFKKKNKNSVTWEGWMHCVLLGTVRYWRLYIISKCIQWGGEHDPLPRQGSGDLERLSHVYNSSSPLHACLSTLLYFPSCTSFYCVVSACPHRIPFPEWCLAYAHLTIIGGANERALQVQEFADLGSFSSGPGIQEPLVCTSVWSCLSSNQHLEKDAYCAPTMPGLCFVSASTPRTSVPCVLL